jgi:Ca2+-transporting ATPase
MNTPWHSTTLTQLYNILNTAEHGLSASEAAERLRHYGKNALPEADGDGIPTIFFRQFQSPLILILLVASGIVFFTDEPIDAALILVILFFNAIVGTAQEGKAQNTLRALKTFSETKATVLRDGKEIVIADTEIVPGDMVLLSEGEKVPADARVILSRTVKIDEAPLTGESEPVHKTAETLRARDAQGQQKNMVYKATTVVAGSGRAIVVATGAETAIGKIAHTIARIDTDIPLKVAIRSLSHIILLVVGIISTGIFFLGIATGKSAADMFRTIVSLGVSIVPEGLPIVVTLILAMGVWRMGKRNALVKKLQAVEALGQASVLAVDKTGTLTKNELVIQKIYVNEQVYTVTGVGYEPTGTIQLDGQTLVPANHPELLSIGKSAAYCASARVLFAEDTKRWRVVGDPTEAALLVLAEKLGFRKDDLERESPVVQEIPFDYRLKYHAVLHDGGAKHELSIAGAPEAVLARCTSIRKDGKKKALTPKDRTALEKVLHTLSAEGLRVIAIALETNAGPALRPDSIQNLCFFGFFGMKDATRPEALSAISRATTAGIKVVMITGDHTITAQAIAKEIGIWHEKDTVLTGADIDTSTDAELAKRVHSVSVFARVNPEHKMRIIAAYRARGEVIAMTGDGVNDAPSLVAADLGVAMGHIGTAVAKEASDIVLLDDNLESIIAAVEEGRGIYQRIKKVILYLFSTSFGEVLTITGALFLSLPLPILPAQILWLNFVTDGFLDIALAMEPTRSHVLLGKGDRPKKYLIDVVMGKRMVLMAIVMAAGTLFLFFRYYTTDITKAWTVSLTVLAVFQWANAWNCRSERSSLFAMNPLSNRPLLLATAGVIALQLLALYTPAMQQILHTIPLSRVDWMYILPIGMSIIVAEEIRKAYVRLRHS